MLFPSLPCRIQSDVLNGSFAQWSALSLDKAEGEAAYAVTASSSLSPRAVCSNIDGNSHFSRTKMEPRFVPLWKRYRRLSRGVGGGYICEVRDESGKGYSFAG